MKSLLYGFGLGIQFFTVIPFNKALPMNRQTMTAMYGLFPLIGLLIGTISFGVLFGLQQLEFSQLFIAIIYILSCIVLTGGLHLDGWVDVSDAFFSYQDQEKRHAILEDPRTGAFGVISVICLLLLKLAVVYEVLVRQQESLWFIVLIPMVARMTVVYFFNTVKPMKEKGIAFYFKSNVSRNGLWGWLSFYIVTLSAIAILCKLYIIFIYFALILVICMLLKRFVNKHFGGMNGDILGALCEGMEVILWSCILLLFI